MVEDFTYKRVMHPKTEMFWILCPKYAKKKDFEIDVYQLLENSFSYR